MHEETTRRSLADYLGIARRRWAVGTLTCGTLLMLAAAVAMLLPPVYRSTATILIEQQEIPQDLVRSTITSFADQRVQLINQRVMTTANLLDIVRKHGLYAEDFAREPREVIVDRMREDIHVDMISADVVDPRSGRPVEATIAFTVAYDNRSPVLAARVANELTSLYLQENSETRRQQAAEASAFLAEEAERLRQDIAALEARLADFKQANVYRLPELTQLNLQLLNRAELDLEDLERQRSFLTERRIYLESELASVEPRRALPAANGEVVLDPEDRMRALEAYLASVRGVYTESHPDIVRTQRSIAALREQLGAGAGAGGDADLERDREALRAEREALLERYEPSHPDVVRLERRIADAEERLAAQGRAEAEPGDDDAERADNPAYVQLQAQLASVLAEMKVLDTKEVELRARLAELEERLVQTPAIERDYYALTRDLESARLKYLEVSAKQKEAVVAENLEMDAKAERFTLIEPPLEPQRPVAPNRGVILFLGVVVALGASAGVVALLETLDRSVHGVQDLQALVGGPPLGVIPTILTTDDRRRLGRRRAHLAGATAVAVLALGVLVHFFVAPVDELWFAALRRWGA